MVVVVVVVGACCQYILRGEVSHEDEAVTTRLTRLGMEGGDGGGRGEGGQLGSVPMDLQRRQAPPT